MSSAYPTCQLARNYPDKKMPVSPFLHLPATKSKAFPSPQTIDLPAAASSANSLFAAPSPATNSASKTDSVAQDVLAPRKCLTASDILPFLKRMNDKDPKAAYELGKLCYTFNDYDRAIKALTHAAEQYENTSAMLLLGHIFLKVKGDAKQGLSWLEKGKEIGDLKVIKFLAKIHLSGDAGKKDPVQAVQLLEIATRADDLEAINKLYEIYTSGEGEVDSDPIKALELAQKIEKLTGRFSRPAADLSVCMSGIGEL